MKKGMNWRRVLALLLAALMVTSLAACSAMQKPASEPQITEAESSAEKPTEETQEEVTLTWFVEGLSEDDIVMVTADHGCDPAYTATTDHTREYVPLLIAGKRVKPVNLGTRSSFADIAATVAELLGVRYETAGKSFAGEIL